MSNDQFDVKKFNDKFEETVKHRKELAEKAMQEKLNKLNEVNNKKKEIYQLSVGDTIINTKDALFNILDDMLQFKFKLDTFTKDNRLYYIGITILLICIVVFAHNIFFESDKPKCNCNNVNVQYVYKLVDMIDIKKMQNQNN